MDLNALFSDMTTEEVEDLENDSGIDFDDELGATTKVSLNSSLSAKARLAAVKKAAAKKAAAKKAAAKKKKAAAAAKKKQLAINLSKLGKLAVKITPAQQKSAGKLLKKVRAKIKADKGKTKAQIKRDDDKIRAPYLARRAAERAAAAKKSKKPIHKTHKPAYRTLCCNAGLGGSAGLSMLRHIKAMVDVANTRALATSEHNELVNTADFRRAVLRGLRQRLRTASRAA